MKKNLKLLSLILLLGFSAHAQTFNFVYTGGPQAWTVPTGVFSIGVDIQGATGGASSYYSPGGCGGQVVCTLAVTPGQVLNIYVGGRGSDGLFFSGGLGGTTGAFPSGGDGGVWYAGGGGGGGATDIRIGGTTLLDRVLAAGGGGGAGDNCYGIDDGGNGGGATAGADGVACGGPSAFDCGAGGTLAAGGAGALSGGFTGAALVGGNGGAYYFQSGGGGGGGYWGGGGGFAGGGGGGSSFASGTLATAVAHTQGANCSGDGSASITILCIVPTGGAIVGSSSICTGSTITYTNPTGTPGGTWSSSATGTFTVNPTTGVVSALAAGTGTLTYSVSSGCGSASATLAVTVSATASPITGDTLKCAGTIDTLYNATAGGTWSSATTSVGTIDPATGIYAAVGPGTTVISYTLGSCSVNTVLTVNITPSPLAGSPLVCETYTMTLTTSPSGGTWSSTTPGSASVDPISGVITGVAAGGTTYIDYTLPTGCAASRFISVNTVPSVITGPTNVCQGNAIALTQSVPGGAWTSSNTAIAIVSTTPSTFFPGYVTGMSGGVVTISYTKASCPPATYVVTVDPGPAPITGPTTICTGMTTILSTASTGGFWSSTNPDIVVTSSGAVTSSTIGAVGTIYYTFPTGCYASVPVNVSYGPPAMVGPFSICAGGDSLFTNSDPTGIWSSTDLAIAQIIDSSGVVTGMSAGVVNISYTLPNGCYAVQPLTVNPRIPGVVSISRFPSGIICEDDTVLVVATPVAGGGTAPAFTWKKFSVTLPGEVNDTFVYRATRPTGLHGDVINVFMYPNDGCPMFDSVADSVYMDVAPKNVHPAITITTTGPDTVAFLGQTVTFSSSVTWGGPSPLYQWFRNGVAIPGANASTYTTNLYGRDTFRCEVIGNPPCLAPTLPLGLGISNSIIIYNFLGADALTTGNNQLSLFPNPNNGTFTLSGKVGVATNDDVYYEVTNMLGQVVHKGQATPVNGEIKARIQTEGLAPGTYMLRVNTVAGNEAFHFVIGK